MRLTKFKHIVVDERNYVQLKKLGNAGDSFNDVITEVLAKIGAREEEKQKRNVQE